MARRWWLRYYHYMIGDTLTLAQLNDDPDPYLARMRAEEPVCWVPSVQMYFVTRWDDVAYVEDHPELFTAATEPSFLARTLGESMLTLDPPKLDRIRSIMLPSFKAGGRSGEFAKGELRKLADGILDMIVESGDRSFDLIDRYAQPLAAGSLAKVLGLDHHSFDQMWDWCCGLVADISNFEDDPELQAIGDKTKAEISEALEPFLAQSRASAAALEGKGGPGQVGQSAIDAFILGGATSDEIINNVRLMISGGINEPCEGIGLVAFTLLNRPDLRKRIQTEPQKMGRLVEEVLRLYCPVGTVTRQATQDLELAGVAIPKGALVSGVLRSINQDESHWDNPMEIDLDRRQGPHAAFALGAHRCLGEWLGRQVLRQGVEQLLARFPNLALDRERPMAISGFEFRGPTELWLLTGE